MESEQPPSQEELLDAVYQFAAQELANGVSPRALEQNLVGQGVPADAAHNIVEELRTMKSQVEREAGKKNMIFGALWCVGGLVVTIFTMQAAQGGGRYVVAWGAVLFGGIQFIRGFAQFVKG